MTNDYIRKQDAIDAFEDTTFTKNEIRRRLLDIEPSDVVPVVRCKDCKHHAYDEIFSCYWCEYPGRVRDTTPDGFCEKGEE